MSSGGDISHSFTDLMTSLAVIFILLLVASLNNAHSETEETIKDLRKEVADELRKLNLTLTQDPDDPYTQIINLDQEKVKFEYSKSFLNPDAQVLIGELFRVLAPALCDNKLRSKLESVIIEGHTDSSGNVTLEGKLENVELSQKRAYSVMKRAFNAIDESTPLNVDCLRNIVSATGRGSNHPLIGRNDDDPANRRVEIKIRVKPVGGLDKAIQRSTSSEQ